MPDLPPAPPVLRHRIATVFGTRPEIIKLAPVLHALAKRSDRFSSMTVATGQHVDLLKPFVDLFRVRVDYHLHTMQPGQSLTQLCARILSGIDPILEQTRPAVVLVQGDTTTALAATQAAFHRHIPVAHVEAGLRTDNPARPFPEEMNRRLISRMATWHFAATSRNRQALLDEGVDAKSIALTGNPVVDALEMIVEQNQPSARLTQILTATQKLRRIVLTTHRRENFGTEMTENLRVLRSFVVRHADVGLIFPVHPNPAVRQVAQEIMGGHKRIWLTEPLDYVDFIGLLSRCWLIVSDSGGRQEEAPSLKKPLLVLRDVTERPEAIEVGAAELVGGSPRKLERALKANYWKTDEPASNVANPFGNGDAGDRIVRALEQFLAPPRQPSKRRKPRTSVSP